MELIWNLYMEYRIDTGIHEWNMESIYEVWN